MNNLLKLAKAIDLAHRSKIVPVLE